MEEDWLAVLSAPVLGPKLKEGGAELAPLVANGLLNDDCSPPVGANVKEELALPPNKGAVDCVFCCV